MPYQEVTDLNAENVTPLGGPNKKTGKPNPKEVEGYYLGSRKVDSKKARSGFAYIHVFQTSGGNKGVWGKTDMDRKILAVTPGTMTKVTHTGSVPTPNGDMYTYKVQFDKTNVIEVSELSQDEGTSDNESNGRENEAAESSWNDENETEADEEINEPAPAQLLNKSAEERRNAVQARLSKGKSK